MSPLWLAPRCVSRRNKFSKYSPHPQLLPKRPFTHSSFCPKGVCFKRKCLYAQDPECVDGARVVKSLRFDKPKVATADMNMQISVDHQKKISLAAAEVSLSASGALLWTLRLCTLHYFQNLCRAANRTLRVTRNGCFELSDKLFE